jgi:hypothetical protein
MSHFHYCDYAGHEWECTGAALRPLAGDTEPSICMCQMHQVPLAYGDHRECPVELLACPEHCDEQLRDMDTFDMRDLSENSVDVLGVNRRTIRKNDDVL